MPSLAVLCREAYLRNRAKGLGLEVTIFFLLKVSL